MGGEGGGKGCPRTMVRPDDELTRRRVRKVMELKVEEENKIRQ